MVIRRCVRGRAYIGSSLSLRILARHPGSSEGIRGVPKSLAWSVDQVHCMRLWGVLLLWGLGVLPACGKDLFKLLLDLSVLGRANAILCLAMAVGVVVELAGDDFSAFPFSPLNVPISGGSDCVSHDITVVPVSVRGCCSWVLAEGSGFPSLLRVFQ